MKKVRHEFDKIAQDLWDDAVASHNGANFERVWIRNGIAKRGRGRVLRTTVLDDWQREDARGSAAAAADPRSLLRHRRIGRKVVETGSAAAGRRTAAGAESSQVKYASGSARGGRSPFPGCTRARAPYRSPLAAKPPPPGARPRLWRLHQAMERTWRSACTASSKSTTRMLGGE